MSNPKKNPKKRCVVCHRWYPPDYRIGEDQLTCDREECRKERKAAYDRQWWQDNPDYAAGRKGKLKTWAEAHPGYWRQYRAAHPEYAERERARMRSRRQGQKSVAKQVLRRQITVEKLRSIQALATKTVAKQVSIHRRVDGIVEYLAWKEGVAKQVSISPAPAP